MKATQKARHSTSAKLKRFAKKSVKQTAQEKKELRFYETWTFLIIFCVIFPLLFRSFAYSPFHIPSSSMKPSLLIGDYIFVSKFSYGYSRYSLPFGFNIINDRVLAKEPERGDVIVFRLPSDTSIDYIKRLIGLPGDKIQMKKGILYINNKPVQKNCNSTFNDEFENGDIIQIKECEETLPNGISYKILDQYDNGNLDNTNVYTVPPGHYFFMGDNRDNSKDSRVIEDVGYVAFNHLVGRADMVFFSLRHSLLDIGNWLSLFRQNRFFEVIQ